MSGLTDAEREALDEAQAAWILWKDRGSWGSYIEPAVERIVAARVATARADAEADRDHWKAHAEEAGEGFARVCLDYARVSSRNVELVEALAAARADEREKVLALHRRFESQCVEDQQFWPCGTVAALAQPTDTEGPTS